MRFTVPRPTQLHERESRQASLATVYRYHDATKHHFHASARSLGYLDWASQPHPFRNFADTPVFPLYPAPGVAADGYARGETTFDQACERELAAAPLSAAALGDMLRHALGLSAWKRAGSSRWSLRVNPSSGNLHPTEAYVLCGALSGLMGQPAVYHYARLIVTRSNCAAFSTSACGARHGNTASGRSATASMISDTRWRPCLPPPPSSGGAPSCSRRGQVARSRQ